MYTAAVITISDKGAIGERIDTSGPNLVNILKEHDYDVVYTTIIPDDFDKIKAEMGPVDVLVCNPNASCPKTLLETTAEEWNEVLAINVHSIFYCCKQVFADMKERKTGEVILFSDDAAFGVAGNAAFAITKASALGIVGSCSRESEKYGVTCNCVTPTVGATPEDVADTVALLASEEGRPLHGQTVKVIKNWTKV